MPRSMLIVTVLALVGSLVGTTRVLAQELPGVQAGITTTGYGEATAPAETAELEFLIMNESFYGGPPPVPQVEATPGAAARETLAPIAGVIEASDAVERVEVVIPLVTDIFGGPAPIGRIDVSVSNPGIENLTNLVSAVTQATAAERLFVGHVGARFETRNCQALERGARQAALDDARYRAGIQADLLGVGLGEVIASTDISPTLGLGPYGPQLAPAGGCDPHVSGGSDIGFSSAITLPRFDPTAHSGDVEVYRQLRVTFAIEEDTAATPAT